LPKHALNIFGIIMLAASFVVFITFTEEVESDYDAGKITAAEKTLAEVGIGALNGAIIFVLGVIYNILAVVVCRIENHEFENEYENSLIFKDFIFQFLNSYLILFYYAYYKQSFSLVSSNILSLTISKQGLSIVKSNVLPYLLFMKGRRAFIKKWQDWRSKVKPVYMKDHEMLDKTWADLAKETTQVFTRMSETSMTINKKDALIAQEEEWLLLEQIEETRIMSKDRDLNKDYEISALSFGYICFFSAAYPISVTVLMLLASLKLLFDVFAAFTYQRRYSSAPTKSIGSWNIIFETLTFLSTIANAAFVWFACDGLKKLLGETSSSSDDDMRDIAIIIVAEHVIFVLKVYLSNAIPDVPNYVCERTEVRDYRKRTEKLKLKSKALEHGLKRKAQLKKEKLAGINKSMKRQHTMSPLKDQRAKKININRTGGYLEQPMFKTALSLSANLQPVQEEEEIIIQTEKSMNIMRKENSDNVRSKVSEKTTEKEMLTGGGSEHLEDSEEKSFTEMQENKNGSQKETRNLMDGAIDVQPIIMTSNTQRKISGQEVEDDGD
jgi:hypothetical protein